MSLTVPNLDRIAKESPKLGEAIQKVQQYANQNVTPVSGNRLSPPTFLTTTRPAG